MNGPNEGQNRRSAATWVLIGLIVGLAILVPVGLYWVSQVTFGGGATGGNLSAPSTGTQTPPVANGGAPRPVPLPQPAPSPGNGLGLDSSRTMDWLVIDEITKKPIAGMIVEVTGGQFSKRTGADGHVRIPLPKQSNPSFYNVRVRGKDYVPMRMLWTPNQAALNDTDYPATYTMEMEKGTRIGGKIVDEAGKPVAGVTLGFDFTKHFSNPHQLIAAIAGFNRAKPTVSDAEGNWSFAAAPPNCEDIEVEVLDRHNGSTDRRQPQGSTPVSQFYDGTATIRVERGAATPANAAR